MFQHVSEHKLYGKKNHTLWSILKRNFAVITILVINVLEISQKPVSVKIDCPSDLTR